MNFIIGRIPMKKDYKIRLVTFNRLAIYILTFLVLLSLAFLLTNFWKDWDYTLYKNVYLDKTTATDKLSDKIVIVNIEKPNLTARKAHAHFKELPLVSSI